MLFELIQIKKITMKAKFIITGILALTMSLAANNLQAQSVGIASSKEKQAALEKRHARQVELRKKYDAMSPEEQARVKQKAIDRKNGGYKNDPKPVKPVAPGPAVNNKTNAQGKQGNKVQPTERPKPILLDSKGKPINPKPAPVTPAKNEVKPSNAVKPSPATPVKKPATPAANPTNAVKKSSTGTTEKK